ncbi:MAG: hypothetical protein NVSMB21_15940 [Vulcanimicrobiaceae bacterium]
MATLALRGFAATQNFTLLHAMTGTHAMRTVIALAPDRDALLQAFWRAFVAAYVSAGAPPIPDDATFVPELAHAPPWDDLLLRASASDDEHVIKAAYTAWTEWSHGGDPLYRLAVARYMTRRG